MHRRPWSILLLAAVTCGLAACGTAPVQEMSDARQAVQAARDAEAARHAAPMLTLAERRLARAEQAIEVRDFGRARGEATAARDSAFQARQVAVTLRNAEVALAEARRAGVEPPEARRDLAEARTLGREGDYRGSVRLAEGARRVAEDAVNRRLLDRSQQVLQRAEPRLQALGPDDQVRYQEAQAAVEREDGRKAFELASAIKVPPASSRPSKRRADVRPTPARRGGRAE